MEKALSRNEKLERQVLDLMEQSRVVHSPSDQSSSRDSVDTPSTSTTAPAVTGGASTSGPSVLSITTNSDKATVNSEEVRDGTYYFLDVFFSWKR